MTPERHLRLQEIFELAVTLSEQRRQVYLAQACADDPSLRERIDQMLSADDETILNPGPPSASSPPRVMECPKCWQCYEQSHRSCPTDGSLLEFAFNGTRLIDGKYLVQRRLGRGGMGAVYRAHDTRLGRDVAVKITQERFNARFEREARAIAALNHPNICTLHDVGPNYLVMELVEGETLKSRLAAGPLAPDKFIDLAIELTDALTAAHSKKIIHRDIKPANIFITERGHAKILDFGLAKLKSGHDSGSNEKDATLSITVNSLTVPGAIMGTPSYMSPEQACGDEVDATSDLFSLGAVFYEMATGMRSFDGGSTVTILRAILQKDPVPPSQLNPKLPRGVDEIVLKALEKDRSKRFQHAEEIRAALEDLKTTAGTGPKTISLVTNKNHRKRIFTRLPLVGAGAVAIVAVFVWAVWRHGILWPAHPAITDVAVMPFRVIGGDPALEFLTEGLSEGLSFRLSQLQGLHVPPNTEVEQIAATGTAQEVSRQLGVDRIIQGSVSGTLQQLKIDASVEDQARQRRIAHRTFSGGVEDVIAIEDRMCASVASSLGLDKAYSEEKCRAVRPTQNVAGYELYLEGRARMRKDQVDQALDLYMKAVANDKNFALAYTGIVDACLAKYQSTKEARWLDEALNAAVQAQMLNDNLPEVHFALGTVYADTGKALDAVDEIKRGVSLSPTDEGFRRLGEAYQASGQLKYAIVAYRSAIEINPHYSNNFYRLGVALNQSGDSAQALTAFQHFKELEPDNPAADENIAAEYINLGDYEKAVSAFRRAVSLKPDADAYSNLGTALFNLKRYPESVGAFERARDLSPNDATYVGNLADAYRWAGRKQDAERAYLRAVALAHSALESNPKDAEMMANLALYNAKVEHGDEAMEWINRARSISPEDVYVEYSLATIQTLAHENRQACDTLRGVLGRGFPPKVAQGDPELTELLGSKECAHVFADSKSK